jgi:hypothetical protein
MLGWIAQWYVNVPAVVIAVGVLVAPPPSVPVLKPPESPVDVCAIASALRQAIVWPTRMLIGFGEYELMPSIPWIETVTSAGVTGVVGVVGVDELPQPANVKRPIVDDKTVHRTARRIRITLTPLQAICLFEGIT